MPQTEIKAFNAYAISHIREGNSSYVLEALRDGWEGFFGGGTTKQLARSIADHYCQGGINIGFHKLILPNIGNASPKVGERDYGLVYPLDQPSDEPRLLRALFQNELIEISEELSIQRKRAKKLDDLIKKVTGNNGTIDPRFLTRVLWEEVLD